MTQKEGVRDLVQIHNPPSGVVDERFNIIPAVHDSLMQVLQKQVRSEQQKNKLLLKENERLKELVDKDSLTGLYNREYLESVVAKRIFREKKSKCAFGVLMIDIDFFKKINDGHGHPAGDEVLKNVANALQKISRASDVAVRYGGEEFCIILFDVKDVCKVVSIAERYRESVSATVTIHNGENLSVTVSVGACFAPSDSLMDLNQVIAYADNALYGAKDLGRNCVVVSDRRKALR